MGWRGINCSPEARFSGVTLITVRITVRFLLEILRRVLEVNLSLNLPRDSTPKLGRSLQGSGDGINRGHSHKTYGFGDAWVAT